MSSRQYSGWATWLVVGLAMSVSATSCGGSGPSADGSTDGASGGSFSSGGSATPDDAGTATGGSPGGAAGSENSPGTPGTVVLSDVCALEGAINAWGPIERNGSNGEQAAHDGGPLTLDGTIHASGFGMHAPADIGFALARGCTKLEALVGIDDEMGDAGAVRFEVWGDGTRLFQSDTLTGSSAALPIAVDVAGVDELRLVANDDGGNGSDHADWADVKLSCSATPLAACAAGAPPIVAPEGYHLAWSDEFDVDGAPNPDNWGFEQGFVRNEEAQWYQSDNAQVQAGYLIIEGRREQLPNPNYQAGSGDWKKSRQFAEYTSSSMHSRGKRSFRYGRFEMRARIIAAAGLWPAFWTLGVAGEWPSCGEIDIMEYYGSRVRANVACGTSTQWQAKWDSVAKLVSDFADDDWDAKFHVWRMDWDDQSIVLSLDGATLNTTNLADALNANGQSPFTQEHYVLVNLALGGPNGGDPANTAFPTRYEVDYVRVFQAD